MNKLLHFLFVIWILCSCNTKKEELNVLTHKGLEYLYLQTGAPFIVADNNLVGLEVPFDSCLYVFNGTAKKMFGTVGQGPDEFLLVNTIHYLNDSTVSVYDRNRRRYYEIIFEMGMSGITTLDFTEEALFTFDMIKNRYGNYVGWGVYPENMFMMWGKEKESMGAFFEFPYRNKEEHKSNNNQIRGMAYQGTFVANPERDKLVYCCLMGDIIHFYELTETEIRLIRKKENSYPKYRQYYEAGGFAAPMDKENTIYYIDAAATSRFVYILKNGIKWSEQFNQSYKGKEIIIHNWEGEEVNRFLLDMPCQFISVDQDDKKLWAVTNDPDPKMIWYDLDQLMDNN